MSISASGGSSYMPKRECAAMRQRICWGQRQNHWHIELGLHAAEASDHVTCQWCKCGADRVRVAVRPKALCKERENRKRSQ